MKKIYLTIALLIGMTTVSFGQVFGNTDGFFRYDGDDAYNGRTGDAMGAGDINLPTGFSVYNDNAGGEAPLGTGLLILTALGAGYTLRKKLQK